MAPDERGVSGRAVRNVTRGVAVAVQARTAAGMWCRMRGMIGRTFGSFDGLIFNRCNAIHTFFMGLSIDVLFLGDDGRVLGLRRSMAPWRLAASPRARGVVELPSGTIERSGTREGDMIEIDGARLPA